VRRAECRRLEKGGGGGKLDGHSVIGQWLGSDLFAATRQKSCDSRECQAVSSVDEGRFSGALDIPPLHVPP